MILVEGEELPEPAFGNLFGYPPERQDLGHHQQHHEAPVHIHRSDALEGQARVDDRRGSRRAGGGAIGSGGGDRLHMDITY